MCVRECPFDAQLTLIDSAQCFSWQKIENHFEGIVAGRRVTLREGESGFDLFGVLPQDEALWATYFDLSRDYAGLARACAGYPVAKEAVTALPGLRVLRQPTWETLLSFIISANNNVQRIRRLVHALIEEVGQGRFPSPAVLAQETEARLRMLGFGYRAPYLIHTAALVRDGFPLEELSRYSYDQAHRLLLTLSGVGDKVADCVQLFALGQMEAFPVDVWMARVMREWFGIQTENKRKIREEALRMFGNQAGLVQQYLFHCARMGILASDSLKGE